MTHRTHVIVFLPYCHTFPLKALLLPFKKKNIKIGRATMPCYKLAANPCQPWSLLPGWNCPDSESIIPPDSVFLPSRYPAEGLRWQDTESAGGSVSHHTCSCPSPSSFFISTPSGQQRMGSQKNQFRIMECLSPPSTPQHTHHKYAHCPCHHSSNQNKQDFSQLCGLL